MDVYTPYYNPQRCFEETKSGAFGVIVAGAAFPRSLAGGRAIAACAYARMLLAALSIVWACWRCDEEKHSLHVHRMLLALPGVVSSCCVLPHLAPRC